MVITPLNINATITRTPDFLQVKQNEDQKAVTDQNNIQQHMEKDTELKKSQVRNADDADNNNQKFDAREKGNGFYYARKKDKKQKSEQKETEQPSNSNGTFDIKI